MQLFAALIFSALMLFGDAVYATDNIPNSVDLSSLTAEQRLEVLKKVEEAKKPQSSGPAVDPKKVAEWLQVGQQVAGLVPIFAQNTAIAAQQVLDSTPGKILLGIVLVKMFWGKLMGIAFLTLGLAVWWHMFKKVFVIREVTYQPHPNSYLSRWFGLRQKTVIRNNFGDLINLANNVGLFWVFLVAGVLNLLFGVIGIVN